MSEFHNKDCEGNCCRTDYEPPLDGDMEIRREQMEAAEGVTTVCLLVFWLFVAGMIGLIIWLL